MTRSDLACAIPPPCYSIQREGPSQNRPHQNKVDICGPARLRQCRNSMIPRAVSTIAKSSIVPTATPMPTRERKELVNLTHFGGRLGLGQDDPAQTRRNYCSEVCHSKCGAKRSRGTQGVDTHKNLSRRLTKEVKDAISSSGLL